VTDQSPIKPERHAIIAQALEQLVEGKSVREIAEAVQMPRSTLQSWLLGEVPEQYRAIQQQGLISRIVEADEEIDGAPSHLALARAREKARFARWDAERRLKHLFGPSQEISGPGGGPIQLDNLERARRFAFLQAIAADAPIIESSPVSPSTSATT
jgi:hypothetical protein